MNLFLTIFFVAACLISISICVMSYRVSFDGGSKPQKRLVSKEFLEAMAELDDIDRATGLLPPKAEPLKPKPVTYEDLIYWDPYQRAHAPGKPIMLAEWGLDLRQPRMPCALVGCDGKCGNPNGHKVSVR